MEKKTVIVSDDCPHCARVKKNIEERGLPIRIVDFDSEEGSRLVKEHNIIAVPECFVIENGKARKCSDSEFDEMW